MISLLSPDQSSRHPTNTPDRFYDLYARYDVAYGLKPSAELASYLAQALPQGQAIDLGAGAGRNSIALAKAGLKVRAVDTSSRGLANIVERARREGVLEFVNTEQADVRDIDLPEGGLSVLVATTVLDHIPLCDAKLLWMRIEKALSNDGVIYAEVHTVEDPGCRDLPGCENPYPISETAFAIQHYFRAGELLRIATASGALRVLRYEERQEWDYTHGPAHHHGKAILLCVRAGFYPAWYGYPIAFPYSHR